MLKVDKIKRMMQTMLQKNNLGITQLDYFVDQVSLIKCITKKLYYFIMIIINYLRCLWPLNVTVHYKYLHIA